MKKCTKCGHSNRDSDAFCINCGNPLDQDPNKQNASTQPSENAPSINNKQDMNYSAPPKKSSAGRIILTIVIIVLICVIGVLVFDYLDNVYRISDLFFFNDPASVSTSVNNADIGSGTSSNSSSGRINSNISNSNSTANKTNSTATNLLLSYNATQKYNLNIFLSNFSEAYLEYYDHNNVDPAKMISFAFVHDIINNNSAIKWDIGGSNGSRMGIAASRVNTTLDRYFGISISHKSIGHWQYDGSTYWTGASSGEGYGFFSVALSLEDRKDGTYTVKFNNYTFGQGNETVPKKYYGYSDSDAKSDSLCTYRNSGTAIVKPKGDSWQLLYYNEQA